VNNVVFKTKAVIDRNTISPIRVKGIMIIPEIKLIENTIIPLTYRKRKLFLPKIKPTERASVPTIKPEMSTTDLKTQKIIY
jgi:hypothetical protein